MNSYRKLLLSLCFIASLSVKVIAQTSQRPNIIFILTDDQRYDLLGCTGNNLIKTPNIDKLASDGTLFTNAHVTSAICTPSRISILLSQFERKHGVNFNSGTSVSEEAWQNAYPMVLKRAGYYTGYVGKNHSPIGDGGYESGVMDKSFDYWYAGHKHLGFYPKEKHPIFKNAKHDTQVEIIGEGATDFLSNEHRLEGAMHFLNNRPKNQPFNLNICFNLPHDSSSGTMKQLETDSIIYRDLYRDINIPLPKYYIEKENIKTPKLPAGVLLANERQAPYDYVEKEATVKERIIRQMQAVTGIDGLLGNLRKTLKEQGLDKNTIIVFTSDHGLFLGEFGLGGKALCYETTTHVPLIVYNPLLPKRKVIKKSDALVQTIDIAPTLLSYANVSIPESYQGRSFNEQLLDKNKPIRDYLFTENLWSTQFGNPRCESVQNIEWKYIRYYKNENLGASEKIKAAKMLGISEGDMLYKQHDPDIAQYRVYVEAPLKGEQPVYEELFHLKTDPDEITNLATNKEYEKELIILRQVWKEKITFARGTGNPKVLRYTNDYILGTFNKQD